MDQRSLRRVGDPTRPAKPSEADSRVLVVIVETVAELQKAAKARSLR